MWNSASQNNTESTLHGVLKICGFEIHGFHEIAVFETSYLSAFYFANQAKCKLVTTTTTTTTNIFHLQ